MALLTCSAQLDSAPLDVGEKYVTSSVISMTLIEYLDGVICNTVSMKLFT